MKVVRFYWFLIQFSLLCTSATMPTSLPLTAAQAMKTYGDQPVSKEIEDYIREVLTYSKVPNVDRVRICQMNAQTVRERGQDNPFVINGILFVDQGWLGAVTMDRSAFVIGHEAVHLKYGHAEKQRAVALGGICLSMIVGLCSIYNLFQGNIKKSATLFGKACGIFAGTLAAAMWLSRRFELQADKESARAFDNYSGGISFLRPACGHIHPSSWFDTHPSDGERTQALTIEATRHVQHSGYVELF